MSQNILQEDGGELAESPAALPTTNTNTEESKHPGLRSSLVNVPVTPGIHLGEYASDSSSGAPSATSYFQHDISRLRETMAHDPELAASGEPTNKDILRRMSLSGGRERSDSLIDTDPRAANPTLGLSGGIISATFCIPHSLAYRKGADWVSGLARKLLIKSLTAI